MTGIKTTSILLLAGILIFNYHSSSASAKPVKEIMNFNFDWKFMKGDQEGAQNPQYDDSSWRMLDLPHDWSIEGPFSQEWASGTGYLPGGIGWYRKTFQLPSGKKDGRTFIYFDGVYNNSEVWINGTLLGKRPNGYISFQYDLTPYLLSGRENVIAVRVDHSKFGDSRWYTGSGIYRDVKLVFTPQVHFKQWGVSYSTPSVTGSKAEMTVEVVVVNEQKNKTSGTITNRLLLGSNIVAESTGKISFDGSGEKSLIQKIEISDPKLWSVETPVLYTLETIFEGKNGRDEVITKVGFRNFSFDPDKGFFLNGKNMKLKGICMHHDAGALGSAVPRKELERRLDILKEMGCNSIRTSHNPFSSDFLELCDEKGFLVIDEAFDEWEMAKKKWIKGWNQGIPGKDGYAEYFSEWAVKDLRDLVLRDRNHPCVIMWSIGNEIDYPNDPYSHPVLDTEGNPQTRAKYDKSLPNGNRLGEIARELVAVIKELDRSRPVTAGLASALMSNATGYAEALDVAGYNYQEYRYPGDHEKYPKRNLYGSENSMSLEAWNAVADNDYVSGQFLWTGFEYLGEAGQYPSRHSTSGIIDLAGNRKPEFYFRQSLWSDKPMVFLGTTDRLTSSGSSNLWAHKRVDPVWNWKEGQTISVNAFTNCSEVELYLNGTSLGSREMSDFQNRTISWDVPYSPGLLKAVARNNGKDAAVYEIKTTGDPVAIDAICDFRVLKPDRQDLARVYLTVIDKDGNTVYTSDNEITCTVSGPARILGMEDANPRNIEDYKDNKQHAFHGKLLVYLQSLDKPGRVKISLSSPGLKGKEVEIDIK
jgi:beta-galactosidase